MAKLKDATMIDMIIHTCAFPAIVKLSAMKRVYCRHPGDKTQCGILFGSFHSHSVKTVTSGEGTNPLATTTDILSLLGTMAENTLCSLSWSKPKIDLLKQEIIQFQFLDHYT